MHLDTYTVYSVVLAAAVIGAALLWILGRRSTDDGGLRSWSASMAGLAVYFAAVLFGDELPTLIGIGLANTLAVLFMGGLHRSASMLCGRPFSWALHLAAATAVLVVVSVFLLDPGAGFDARVMLVGVVTGVQSAVVASTLARRGAEVSEDEIYGRRVLATAFAGIAVMQMLRVLVHSPLMSDVEPAFLSQAPLSHAAALGFLAWIVAVPVTVFYIYQARARAALEATVVDLRAALAEVKVLRELLPMCASCRRIRDEEQQWSSLETFLTRHAGVQISHGLCPDCLVQLYPEYYSTT